MSLTDIDKDKLIVADGDSESQFPSSFNSSSVHSQENEVSLSSSVNHVDELDTSTSSNDSTTSSGVEISLPDSFNDSISLNGLSINSKLSPRKVSILEVKLLQSQLVDARREIMILRQEKQSDLALLNEENYGFTILAEEEYRKQKNVPTNQQSVLDRLQIKIYEILSAKMEALQRDQDRAKQTCEAAKLEKDIASKAKAICKEKQSEFEQSMGVSTARQKKMEEKVHELQDTLIESQNKIRAFDDVVAKNDLLSEKEIRLKTLIQNQEIEIKNEKVKVTQKNEEVISLERKVQSLETDYSFLMKEKKALSERVTVSEDNFKRSESALRDVTVKHENLMINLSKERACAQEVADTKRTIEMKRCHDESERNLTLYQSKVEEAFKREVRILEETKSDITVQRDNARTEIEQLKLKLERACMEKDVKISKLEEDLYENRNDLKSKSIENVSIETAYETQNKLVIELRDEVQMLKEKLDVHRNEFKNLEHEHLYQNNRLQDELVKKEQQLELYYQSQMEDFSNDNLDQNKLNPLHLLDKATALQGQCRELKRTIDSIQNQLKQQEEKAQLAEKKLALTESALNDVKLKSMPPVQGTTTNSNNTSVNHLMVQNKALQNDLSRVRQERDKLGNEFTFLLEKYHNAIEFGEKTFGMRNNNNNNSTTTMNTCCSNKTIKVAVMNSRGPDQPSNISQMDPLLVHAKHHGGKIQRLC
jgi:hypothetical protein